MKTEYRSLTTTSTGDLRCNRRIAGGAWEYGVTIPAGEAAGISASEPRVSGMDLVLGAYGAHDTVEE